MVGEARVAEAFPAMHNKSQIVVVVARETGPDRLTPEDGRVADRLAATFHNYQAVALLGRIPDLSDKAGSGPPRRRTATPRYPAANGNACWPKPERPWTKPSCSMRRRPPRTTIEPS